MAKTGPKKKPPHLHAVGNSHRKDRHADELQNPTAPPNNPALEPMSKLTKIEAKVWDKLIKPATWLTEFDVIKAHEFVALAAEFFLSKRGFVSSRHAQLRALQSELGLEYVMASKAKPKLNPNDEFFD